jgi:hypothetical protein
MTPVVRQANWQREHSANARTNNKLGAPLAMQLTQKTRLLIALSLLVAAVSACSAPDQGAVNKTNAASANFVGDFPYHPLVYHLDLSILAYQLHAQSLVWPFDPYYEELDIGARKRNTMIAKVRRWASSQGATQVAKPNGLRSYRGPGSLNGFADNASHDPILYDYSLIHPWSNTLTNAAGTWTEYLTPKIITGKINSVRVCYRPTGTPEQSVTIRPITAAPGSRSAQARDSLWVFEGGTGDKGEAGQPASQSLMGFILLRDKRSGGYDAHIAFRGSRSGSAARAVKQALSDRNANGNPDWITDLGYDRLSPETGGAPISTIGQVHRGFAQSMRSILPNLMHCLAKAAETKRGARPGSIFVTGHSLGGALAQTFVAAMLLGDGYGPSGKGSQMPRGLRAWPWSNVKLVTYGAPRVGDAEFSQALTVTMLQSKMFSTVFNPVDIAALAPNDRSILPRLLDHNRPVGFRVLNSKDPVTTEKVIGGKHVGQTIYVNRPRLVDLFSPPDFSAHEQSKIRGGMLNSLRDPQIPGVAMRYRKMTEINPARIQTAKGSRSEIKKIAASLLNYYVSTGTWFDRASFERNVALRFSIADRQ